MHTSLNLLSSMLLLATAALAYPGPESRLELKFKLSNIIYNSSFIFSTPSHYATGSGVVSFNLENSLTLHSTYCSAESQEEFTFFSGDTSYTCDPVPGDEAGSTTFTFSTSGAITVNQIWTWNSS